MDTLLDYFFSSDLIDSAAFTAAGYSIAVAEGLIPMFFAISIVWDMIQRTLGTIEGDRPAYFSKKELLRVGTLMLLAGPVYIGLFWGIATAADSINKLTRPSGQLIIQGQADFSNMLQQQIPAPADTVMGPVVPVLPAPGQPGNTTPQQSTSLFDVVTGSFNIFYLMTDGLGALTLILVQLIKAIVVLFSIVMAKIFFALGPLAIAFSMLPMFKDKIGNWFGVYLNILFVPLTCNLLDVIIFSNMSNALSGQAVVNPMISVVFNVVMIICYCLSYWLTSFYVGSSAAGRVLTTAVSSAGMLVSGGLSKLGGAAAGAAASKAKGAGNIIENTAGATNSAK